MTFFEFKSRGLAFKNSEFDESVFADDYIILAAYRLVRRWDPRGGNSPGP